MMFESSCYLQYQVVKLFNQVVKSFLSAVHNKYHIKIISREWVLDSIAVYTTQPIRDYLLCDVTEEDSIEELDSGDEF